MNRKRIGISLLLIVVLVMISVCPVYAEFTLKRETPNYKVAFFASDFYHEQDEHHKHSGYGYEMMQAISGYIQCTFSYVGYEKSAAECVEMLENGELDLYTAAKITPERQKIFAFSKHPSITSVTCMNVKVGNDRIIAGDYDTYDGIRVGLLRRHSYNDAFLKFAEEKNISCEVVYYDDTDTLAKALINEEIDAMVSSYLWTPEDECTIETFGETPYYIMARKEDQALIDQIDAAIDSINLENPMFRIELYQRYYGLKKTWMQFTKEEQSLLKQMQDSKYAVRAVMTPDSPPYSWYENGNAYGIVPDLFRKTAEELEIAYEIIPITSKQEYDALITSGAVDIWMDMDGYYEDSGEGRYKITDSYLKSAVSLLRRSNTTKKVEKLVLKHDCTATREIIEKVWPNAEVEVIDSLDACRQMLLDGKTDGIFLMSYTAQQMVQDDVQNRFRADLVPGMLINFKMGVSADNDQAFFGLWRKTLDFVADRDSTGIVQNYLENSANRSLLAYCFDHPYFLLSSVAGVFLFLLLLIWHFQAVKSKRRLERAAQELTIALEHAEKAKEAKQHFFSKMSHDIRTPLNVVLGMTQVAQKYKQDIPRLENALDSIAAEGNYLLMLVNSILDVNQLEHGHVELAQEVFRPEVCVRKSADLLEPLVKNKNQKLIVTCTQGENVVRGDANRFCQIIINLVSNAIKYTDAGGTIELLLEKIPDDRYRFTCKDTGIGMTEEFIQHICDEFSRAEDSRVSQAEGSGLGMSVVKGFTELMHGTLHIESELGKGSVFCVEIPFEPVSEEQTEALFRKAAENQDNAVLNGKKVLLVEDNTLNAEIAMELLQSVGVESDWAENGAVGVQYYEDSKPGEYFAVLMDMQMPVMDGLEATKRIRNSNRADSDLLIFAMTANMFADDKKQYHDAGMDGYIEKPINIRHICRMLKEGKGDT